MQVDMPFFKCIDNGKEFLISNSIIALCRGHFFRDECNWVENKFVVFEMLLGENTRSNVIRGIGFDESLKFRVEVAEDGCRCESLFQAVEDLFTCCIPCKRHILA